MRFVTVDRSGGKYIVRRKMGSCSSILLGLKGATFAWIGDFLTALYIVFQVKGSGAGTGDIDEGRTSSTTFVTVQLTDRGVASSATTNMD